MCVQGVDDQCVLQFSLSNASCCALHRLASRVIHRSEDFCSVVFRQKGRFSAAPSLLALFEKKKWNTFRAAQPPCWQPCSPRGGTPPSIVGTALLGGTTDARPGPVSRTRDFVAG